MRKIIRLRGHHLKGLYFFLKNEDEYHKLSKEDVEKGLVFHEKSTRIYRRLSRHPDLKVKIVNGIDSNCGFCPVKPEIKYDCTDSNISDIIWEKGYGLYPGHEPYASSDVIRVIRDFGRKTGFETPETAYKAAIKDNNPQMRQLFGLL